MSEAEKQRRLEYRKKRKTWILRLAAVLAGLIVLTTILSVVSVQLNRERYINYRESCAIEYGVYMKENDFYEESYLGKDFEYVASLIDGVAAEYIYDLYVESEADGEYQYTYRMDAALEIRNKTSEKVLYSSVNEVIPAKTLTGTGREVTVREYVMLDYGSYNQLASDFIAKYGLKDTDSRLVLQMHVDLIGNSAEFDNGRNHKSYVASLNIPLTTKTVDISITSETPKGTGQIPAKGVGAIGTVFKVLVIVFAALSLLLAIGLICFILLTRNTDITYEIRIKRLLRSYRSYIQRLVNGFDMEGYQILQLHAFSEMLEIRDIIQSPILMVENDDKTRTVFLIPTDTKHLYLYEIKVDDYEEIYAQPEEEPREEAPEREKIEEELVILSEEIDQTELSEALAQPAVVLSEIDYVEDDDDKYAVSPEEEGVEVIGVVWAERPNKNKVYRYDPNGEILNEGDTVLVPTRDVARQKEVIRQAAVAHGNHRVAPEHITHPLKKIIGVIKRKAESLITTEEKGK